MQVLGIALKSNKSPQAHIPECGYARPARAAHRSAAFQRLQKSQGQTQAQKTAALPFLRARKPHSARFAPLPAITWRTDELPCVDGATNAAFSCAKTFNAHIWQRHRKQVVKWQHAWAPYGRRWPAPRRFADPCAPILLPVQGGYSLKTLPAISARITLLGHQMARLSGPRRVAAARAVSVLRARETMARRSLTPSPPTASETPPSS